jgi:hypothetical protein
LKSGGITVGDEGEYPTLGRLAEKARGWGVDQHDHRARGLLDDPLDQHQRVP